MSFNDQGHRPHATHFNETPENPILEGPEGIEVTLDTWGPQHNLFPTMYDALVSNWGDAPSRKVNNLECQHLHSISFMEHRTGLCRLSLPEQEYVEKCFAGGTLQQILEMISFSFTISGVSRTCTHQIVRTRHAAFMQHGGRDNDWRHRPWRMPETIRRACRQISDVKDSPELRSALSHPDVLEDFIEKWRRSHKDAHSDLWGAHPLEACIDHHIASARELYAALVDAGIPWQDARFLLPDGMTTYIHAVYNYVSLRDTLANRLEHIMQWEINCVAQLMLREVKMKCPPLLSKYLGSRSDKSGRAEFAGLTSWPPDGKYPTTQLSCKKCGAAYDDVNHRLDRGQWFSALGHHFEPDYSDRTHRPEQNPFWVLHPDSMAGGPVKWIPTNGMYPHQEVTRELT